MGVGYALSCYLQQSPYEAGELEIRTVATPSRDSTPPPMTNDAAVEPTASSPASSNKEPNAAPVVSHPEDTNPDDIQQAEPTSAELAAPATRMADHELDDVFPPADSREALPPRAPETNPEASALPDDNDIVTAEAGKEINSPEQKAAAAAPQSEAEQQSASPQTDSDTSEIEKSVLADDVEQASADEAPAEEGSAEQGSDNDALPADLSAEGSEPNLETTAEAADESNEPGAPSEEIAEVDDDALNAFKAQLASLAGDQDDPPS